MRGWVEAGIKSQRVGRGGNQKSEGGSRQELRVKGCIPLCTIIFRRENGKSLLLRYNTCGGFYVS